jgi:BirA family biotin operon repressor/biotin-[acetyl-CoA-carboxylase] ligase
MSLVFEILKHLADGRFHSGQALGDQLGVSRAAICKAIRHCEDLGLDIHAVSGKGYRLTQALDLLDAERILEFIPSATGNLVNELELLQTVASTSHHLLNKPLAAMEKADICVAEYQTQGRGRRGRQWVSPYGVNLYFSIRWRYGAGTAGLGGLSIAIGVVLLKALASLGMQELQLKWPNDVLLNKQKVAGILIDVTGEANGPCTVVTGVGINLAMPAEQAVQISQPWANLSALVEQGVSRNQILAAVIDEMIRCLQTFPQQGLQAYLENWHEYDAFQDQQVTLNMPDGAVQGRNLGLDSDGALRIEVNGEQRRYVMGDISLRG